MRYLLTLALLLASLDASAELELARGPFDGILEAYANVTGGYPTDVTHERAGARGDGALRGLVLLEPSPNLALKLGGRAVLQGEWFRGGSDGSLAERSFIVAGDFGRLEYGRRMGLPDVLTGYAPNPYTFTTAEYGPHSGPNLDPGGSLPTAFLPATLAQRIDAISALGVSASGFGDLSDKFLYVSPKHDGYLGSLAYAPHVTASDEQSDLLQAAVVHETYGEQNVYRVGGSYSYSGGKNGAKDRHSISGGASAVIDNDWEIGGSSTFNPSDDAYGFASSLNYNRGKWTFGGYGQWARGSDEILRAASVGGSYRPNTYLRFYCALYGYSFDDGASERARGSVWLAGVRASL